MRFPATTEHKTSIRTGSFASAPTKNSDILSKPLNPPLVESLDTNAYVGLDKMSGFIVTPEQSSQIDLFQFQIRQADVPSVFGIALSPGVSGALLAVLGVGGGLYLLLNQVMPAWENGQKLQADLVQKQAQVQQKQAGLKKSEQVNTQLAQAKQQKVQVLNLFANEKNLNTLLMDLDRVVQSSNAKFSQNGVRAKLRRFVPVNQSGEAKADSSLGLEVNGKIKGRVFNVAIEGTFEQTESIIRDIERLQPLLIVRDYQSTLAPMSTADAKGQVGSAIITTSFQLQALMPVSVELATQTSTSSAVTQHQNKRW